MSMRRYMRVGAVAAGGLMLASTAHAQAVFTRANVAEGKPAAQISTGFGRGPQLAVNGNLGEAGTHTTGGDAPPLWWEVDLTNTFALDLIEVFNRDDCCADRLRDFEVMILDENRVEVWNSGDVNVGGANGGASIDYFFDFANDEFRTEIGGNTRSSEVIDFGASSFAGRFIRVEKNIGGVLTLNEVRGWALTDELPRPVLQINRDNGTMSLRNNTGDAIQIIGYSISSDGGFLNQDNWRSLTEFPEPTGTPLGLQNNGEWFTFSAPDSTTDLSEGSLTEVYVGHIARLDLTTEGGGLWVRNPVEDVEMTLKLADGSDVSVLVEYLGDALIAGDMNGDGVLDAFDVAPFEQALADRAAYEAAFPDVNADLIGDQNGDKILDAFDVAGFEAALASGASAAVPEPASLALLGLGGLLIGGRRRR